MTPGNWWNILNVQDPNVEAQTHKRWEHITLFLKDVYNILNKGLVFADNIRGALLTITFDAADTETKIEHGLSYAPRNYLVFSASAAMVLYDGDTNTTVKNIYLKSSAAGVARVFVF